MRDWRAYWNSAGTLSDPDPRRQVGKTVGGRPFTDAQIEAMVRSVVDSLDLAPGDRLLDLGCGNGLLSRPLVEYCAEVVGVDYSQSLIETARARFSDRRIRYVEADIRSLPLDLLGEPFSKVCLYEVLQHLDAGEVSTLLSTLNSSASRGASVLLASVPDRERIWNFYDTPERREELRRRLADGTEMIGTWWRRNELEELISKCGYTPHFADLDPTLDGARYRLDVVCEPIGV